MLRHWKAIPSLHGSKIHYTLWGQDFDIWQKKHESSGIINPFFSHHTQEHAIALKLLSSLRMFVVVGATKTFGLLARVSSRFASRGRFNKVHHITSITVLNPAIWIVNESIQTLRHSLRCWSWHNLGSYFVSTKGWNCFAQCFDNQLERLKHTWNSYRLYPKYPLWKFGAFRWMTKSLH